MLRQMRRWVWIVASIAFVCVAAAGCVAALLYTAWGRARVAHYFNEKVSEGIGGSLVIERIDEIDLPFVRATGVKLIAPDGVPAIDVKKAEIELDFDAIFDGRFAWHTAKVEGGIVRVTEDKQGRVNMEELFRGTPAPGEEKVEDPKAPKDPNGPSPLDLRGMATSDMTLVFYGGSFPKLRMEHLFGIMRVEEKASGQVQIRFDEYRGDFVEGLPTGKLTFTNVTGHVQTDAKRLLRFEGDGESEGEPVRFNLDIFKAPNSLVHIGARFPKLSAEAISTSAFALYTKFAKGLDVDVSFGEGKPPTEDVPD